MKKIIILGVMLMVGLWMAPDAQAAVVRNMVTGNRSFNVATATSNKTIVLNETKLGGVLNLDLTLVNTGLNSASGNTKGVNKVNTGDVASIVGTQDLLNYSKLTIDQTNCNDCEANKAVNNTTGAGSLNIATVNENRFAGVNQTSVGVVANVSLSAVNTGLNSASGNTAGDSRVTSGDVQLSITHISDVNSSVVSIKQ